MSAGSSPARPRTVMELLRLAAQYLRERGSSSPRLDAEVLLGHVVGMERIQLYVNHDRLLLPEEVSRYRESIARRGKGAPVAYITGRKEFLGLTFRVTPDVLVPRPETELLVEAVIERLRDRPDGWVADVGTGSGVIAVCLARALPVRVLAVDLSPAALAVARANAVEHGVAERIEFVAGDLLAPLAERAPAGALAAIVSNPPYIPEPAWANLPADVRDHEPRTALVAGEDGLACIRRLAGEGIGYLRPGGLLALEVGAGQAACAVRLGREAGFARAEILPDYAGHERVICQWKATPTES